MYSFEEYTNVKHVSMDITGEAASPGTARSSLTVELRQHTDVRNRHDLAEP